MKSMSNEDLDHPFTFAFKLISENIPSYQFLSKALQFNVNANPLSSTLNVINEKSTNRTKFNTYVNVLNMSLVVHPIYTSLEFVPDYLRVTFTRILLMSHNLKIETGRWSRIPRERRTCPCEGNHPQTESHVLIDCVLTRTIRLGYPSLDSTDINTLLSEGTHLNLLCKYVHDILDFFK